MLIKMILTVFVIFSITVMVGYGYGESRGMTTSNVDPYSNIIKYEVVERNLIVNQSVEYPFTTPEFGIYQILAYGKENEYDISIRIEDLKNTSKYAKPAPGIVYRNENVWLGSTRINYISVRFRVENSWIKDNGIDDGRLLYLLKWNGTVWSVLKTNMTGKDDIYTYFESPKAGNSRIGIFAISASMRRTDNSINATTGNSTVTSEEEYEEIAPDLEEKEEKDETNIFKGFLGFGMVIVIIGIIIFLIYIGEKKY